ncbi:MAG: polysaccharide pyruvyl transferase family protein, partial [Conexivisphaerales archaeon]
MKFKKYIVIDGYLGLGNIGDEASFEVIYDREVGKDSSDKIVAASHVFPYTTARMFGVEGIKDGLFNLRFYYVLLRAKKLIYAGGGRYGLQTIRKMCLLSLIAKLFRTEVHWEGVGIYDYSWDGSSQTIYDHPTIKVHFLDKFIIRLTMKFVNSVSVRDTYSYNFLNKISNSKKVKEINDLVTGLKIQKSSKEYSKNFYELLHRFKVGISIRTMKATMTSSFISELTSLVIDLITNGMEVVFVPFGNPDEVHNEFDDDKIIARIVIEEISKRGYVDNEDYSKHVHLLRNPLKPSGLLSLISTFDFFICFRFHSIVFSDIARI